MHLGDHCCHCDLYYLYRFDGSSSTMEVRQTCADVTMNDFDFHGNLANHCDAHGHDHVQSIDYDGAMVVKVVLPNGDDAHVDCNDCAVMHVIAAIVYAIGVGRFSLLRATHNRDRRDQNHCQFHVHV